VKWPAIPQLTELAPPPSGYSYAFPTRSDIPRIIQALEKWYPGIAVGNASCHMRESFYVDRVYFGDGKERDFLVTLLKHGDQTAAIFSVERDLDSRVIYGRIGAISPDHRGAHLSRSLLLLGEAIGRAMGMGMVYGLATLKHPFFQRTFEHLGWQLTGIMPGFDQEVVAPGEVRRVYEAVYVKVLEPGNLLTPDKENMTDAVRELYSTLFEQAARPE
jgi:hypothetical protein